MARPTRLTRALLVTLAGAVLGIAWVQEGPAFSGTISGWSFGEGDLVMHSPTQGRPPQNLTAEQPVIGSVASDGSFRFGLPAAPPEERLVPVANGAACADLTAEPSDAEFFPLDVIVYDADGRLAGLLFPVSPGGGNGPVVGGYSVLMGYTEGGVSVSGSCFDPGRKVEERHEASVEPGWHLLVQRFEDHPEREGWRLDRWRSEPMPDDVEWVLLTPPF